jgi:hypothetical protein
MAQKVVVQIFDDLTGEDGAEAVQFAINGTEYEIDLTLDNRDELFTLLSPYTQAGRAVSGKNKRKVAGKPKAVPVVTDADPAAIRAWAVENGHEVNERGRIPKWIVDAYNAS